jgi:glycosyltransferase involved in cell wall biosynthesis
MKFLIVTHVPHVVLDGKLYGYGPYVREMNLWVKSVTEVLLVAPKSAKSYPDPIDLPYDHPVISLIEVPAFDLLTWGSRIRTAFSLPFIFAKTIQAMNKADHIHLRCPGNMGLVGAVAQFFFPKKRKTAKYAGNWDPQSVQPSTYRLQQKILANPAWSSNMKVLVYGDWDSSNSNLLSFFTASYKEEDKILCQPRPLDLSAMVRLIFVGSLASGKNPLISCETLLALRQKGFQVRLDIYGEGPERGRLEHYAVTHGLQDWLKLHGNVSSETLKQAYQEAHFLVFASESEGWPKAVAEAMFWACLPMTTAVSCVPQMVGEGSRGELIPKDPNRIAEKIQEFMSQPEIYRTKCEEAQRWSREYTLERFEKEIAKLLLG